MSTLKDTFTEALAAYNTAVKELEQKRDEVLVMQGSLQQLQQLIDKEETDAVS